jgi:uncharacterized protein YcbX
MKNLVLSEIWIYPIKSLGGIQLSKSRVYEKGLQYDRRWMLADENGTFMTQRINPLMALFKLTIDGNKLTITFRKPDAGVHPSITFNTTDAPAGECVHATIWDDRVEAIETDKQISAWFSKNLGMSCKLLSFPEQNPRPVDAAYQVNKEHVSLADAYPFMIIGQSTLDDLNSRMERKLPMNRFRPNFVFTGGEPYEEDQWRNFTIGKNRFVGVKPCARCVLTTVDQETAEKGAEPLVTLSTYRKNGNKILFGQNVVAIDHLEVQMGDQIVLN